VGQTEEASPQGLNVEFQDVVVHSVENWEANVAKQKLVSGDRMDYRQHARLTIYSREQLAKSVVEGQLSLREAAAERGLSRQSAARWVRRYRDLGARGLADPSTPLPFALLTVRSLRMTGVIGVARRALSIWMG